MNKQSLFHSIALVVLLSACAQSGGGSATETTGAADATPTASPKRQPGSWALLNYTMAFEGKNVAGGMAEMVEAGRSSVGKKQFGGPLCLTTGLAAKDTLEARLEEAIRFGQEWKVVRSTIEDGNVVFEAIMDDPQQGMGKMTITGILTPTTTDLLLTTDSWQPAPGKGHIHTMIKTENTRTGECMPGQDFWQ